MLHLAKQNPLLIKLDTNYAANAILTKLDKLDTKYAANAILTILTKLDTNETGYELCSDDRRVKIKEKKQFGVVQEEARDTTVAEYDREAGRKNK